jgi:hypothetical protein
MIEILRTVERLPQVENRDKWQRGPWDNEPDLVEWRDAKSGYPCLIVRNTFGALCGYVGLPPEHPLQGKGYDDPPVEVHGGLTFANACREGSAICHVPLPGEPDHAWWFGFDCAHAYDLAPGLAAFSHGPRDWEVYRTIAWVTDEVGRLAAQLHELRAAAPSAPSEHVAD